MAVRRVTAVGIVHVKKNKIVQLIKNGSTLRNVAARFLLPFSTLVKALHANEIHTRKMKKAEILDIILQHHEDISEAFLKGKTRAEVAREYGINPERFKRYLRLAGIRIRQPYKSQQQ